MVIELSGVQFGCVITKSHNRKAGVRFVITSKISVQNCTTRSSISTLLYHFEIFKIFVKRKRFCLQKTHLRYLPECCSIATMSEQNEVLLNYILIYVQKSKLLKKGRHL
jgi:hypothetical protein